MTTVSALILGAMGALAIIVIGLTSVKFQISITRTSTDDDELSPGQQELPAADED